MEQDKYFSLADTYKETEGVETNVSQFRDDILNGKRKMELPTESSPKTPVKQTKKNLKNYLKHSFSFQIIHTR